MTIIKGTFTTIWDGGTEITTSAELDTVSGEISTISVDVVDFDVLEDEYFTSIHGEEYHNICDECHEFLTRVEMVEGVGKHLHEVKKCMNPDCNSNF